MQVFGLPGQTIRNGEVASRLLAAKTPQIEAARRRDAVARWRRAMSQGLTAEQAAKAVGVSAATLYRWQKRPEPHSRRPHRKRQPAWPSSLVLAVEKARADNPMWGKRKLAVVLRRQGYKVSVSTIGRILKKLMDRGVVIAVPTLRRKPGGRRYRFNAAKRYAKRLPKGLKPQRPGEMVQIDTLFINISPDKAIKHFTAYDPVAKWTVGHVARFAKAKSAAALLDKLIAEAPFPIRGIQVDGGSEFRAEFEQACADKKLALYVLPPKSPKLNGAVERAQASWRYEFYQTYDLPELIHQLQPFVDAFAYHFNHHRPHQALGDRTPAEYLAAISHEATPPSHMC